jgi:hypothetical protein
MRQSQPIRDWFRQSVSQDGTVALALAIGSLSVMAAVAWYLAPERVEAPRAIHNLTQDLFDVQAAEKRVLKRTSAFVDPAPLFARRQVELRREDVSNISSYVVRSHWFIKVRNDAAKTICVQLMTLLDDEPPRPRCREATKEDWAEEAKWVRPAEREAVFAEAR